MKRPFFSLALLSLSACVLQAQQLYDITLTSAEKFTQCRLVYKGHSKTIFSGKNKSGAEVTKEVKSTSILMMKPVKAVEKPAETAPKPEADSPADTSAANGESTKEREDSTEEKAEEKAEENTDGKTRAEGDAGGEAQPQASEAGEKVQDGNLSVSSDAVKAKDATLRLRQKLASVDTELASLTSPSRSLLSRCKSGKSRVEKKLLELDKLSLEVASLQEQYNSISADYSFTLVTPDQRDQYVRDGQAAHKAMLIDMKERKGSRKIGGLGKFEIMRDRYQGLPEYKQAYEWYLRTLKELEVKWKKMAANEEKRRNSAQPAKRTAMNEADEKEFDRLSAQMKENGEDIATTWYNPMPRNLRMLNTSLNRIKDVLRRAEDTPSSSAVGTVPSLLEQFWGTMDEARKLMVAGDLDGAEEMMRKADAPFRSIIGLNRQLFPDEYKSPLRDQKFDMEREIKRRSRERRQLKNRLERSISMLERSTGTAEAQIDALMEDIEREKDLDTGENTVDTTQGEQEPAAADEGGETPANPESQEAASDGE